jgi:hypothetical protein
MLQTKEDKIAKRKAERQENKRVSKSGKCSFLSKSKVSQVERSMKRDQRMILKEKKVPLEESEELTLILCEGRKSAFWKKEGCIFIFKATLSRTE